MQNCKKSFKMKRKVHLARKKSDLFVVIVKRNKNIGNIRSEEARRSLRKYFLSTERHLRHLFRETCHAFLFSLMSFVATKLIRKTEEQTIPLKSKNNRSGTFQTTENINKKANLKNCAFLAYLCRSAPYEIATVPKKLICKPNTQKFRRSLGCRLFLNCFIEFKNPIF